MASDREIITTISPITDKPILVRNGMSESELADMVARARTAFRASQANPSTHLGLEETSQDKWRDLTERQKAVSRALATMRGRQGELARELTEQMGRPIAYTAKEITTAVARGEYLVRMSQEALGDTPGEAEAGYKRYIRKVPVGVVLIIFAWNVGLLIDIILQALDYQAEDISRNSSADGNDYSIPI